MKTFFNKQNLREFITSRPAVQGTLKKVLKNEGKVTADRKSNLYEGMRSAGNGTYIGKYKTFFHLISLRDN